MPSQKWKLKVRWLVFVTIILSLGFWIGIYSWIHSNPIRQKVWKLVDPHGLASSMYRSKIPNFTLLTGTMIKPPVRKTPPEPQINPFQTIKEYINEYGPEVYVYLNEYANHRDTKWMTFYRNKYPVLPTWLKKHLQAPAPLDQISLHALELIQSLGPSAARACADAVINGISHPNPLARGYAIESFWWIVPDSDVAIDILIEEFKAGNEGFFRRPNAREILKWKWSKDFLRKIQITNTLSHPNLANRVIVNMEQMGAEMAPAIPVLMDVLKPLPKYGDGKMSYKEQEELDQFQLNVLMLLSQFATDLPDVSDFLHTMISGENPTMHVVAARVRADQAFVSPDLVPKLLHTLDDLNLNAWVHKMRKIGHLGHAAKNLVPSLIPFTYGADIKSWYEEMKVPNKQPLTFTRIQNMKLATCVAIGRIEPESVVEHLPFIVEAIGLHSDPVNFLKNASGLSSDIIRLVEPYLYSPSDKKQVIAADILLHHDPDHPNAMSSLFRHIDSGSWDMKQSAAKVVLHHNPSLLKGNQSLTRIMSEGGIRQALPAAHYLSIANGDTQNLLPLIEKGLMSKTHTDISLSINILREIDDKPSKFVPLIQKILEPKLQWNGFLHSPNRLSAFMLLLDYGPEHLPPLNIQQSK